jgi:hypothetical protein
MKTRHLLERTLLAGLLAAAHTSHAHVVPEKPAEKKARQTMQTTATTQKTAIVSGTARTSKTTLDVRVDYSFEAPTAGSMTNVRLAIGNRAGRPLSVEVKPGDGLRMMGAMASGPVMQTSDSAEHLLTVAPDGDGLHYIHVFLKAGEMSEALAIAMPVGKDAAPARAVESRTLPDGRRIKSIPSQP